MENASKALIIAGAILISILLISVGILVMQSANGVTGQMQGQMDATTIRSFNAKFENYVGVKRGSVIKDLISDVSASNVANPDDKIKMSYGGADYEGDANTGNSLPQLQLKIKSTARYTVSVEKNNVGLIDKITIQEGDTTGGTTAST